MSLSYKGIFENWEIAVAKNLVRQFKRKTPCLHREFEDDLVDECLKHWFFVREKYSICEMRDGESFLAKVVTNKLVDLVKNHLRNKREKYFQAVSLDQFLEDNSDSPFLAHPIQQSPADASHSAELEQQIGSALSKLTPQQQEIYFALIDEELTITQISLRLKVHRGTVHNEIKRIRKVFENEGLKKYLS